MPRLNPQHSKFVIFSGGGGLVERKQMVKIDRPGINSFEIMDVPASFDPDTTSVEINNIKPTSGAELMQIVARRPDRKYIEDYIERERSASDRIISESVNLRSEIRDEILKICESAYYRKYEDMAGELVVIIDAAQECELDLTISYFLNDDRIFWTPGLQVELDNAQSNQATLTGYIIVENNTSFAFENVELLFAEFERPRGPVVRDNIGDTFAEGSVEEEFAQMATDPSSIQQEMRGELRKMKQVKRFIK